MDESLRVRREKVLARKRLKREFAEGKIRLEQFCLAATTLKNPRAPLIFPELDETDFWRNPDDVP
jgi:hypothetical protein